MFKIDNVHGFNFILYLKLRCSSVIPITQFTTPEITNSKSLGSTCHFDIDLRREYFCLKFEKNFSISANRSDLASYTQYFVNFKTNHKSAIASCLILIISQIQYCKYYKSS